MQGKETIALGDAQKFLRRSAGERPLDAIECAHDHLKQDNISRRLDAFVYVPGDVKTPSVFVSRNRNSPVNFMIPTAKRPKG